MILIRDDLFCSSTRCTLSKMCLDILSYWGFWFCVYSKHNTYLYFNWFSTLWLWGRGWANVILIIFTFVKQIIYVKFVWGHSGNLWNPLSSFFFRSNSFSLYLIKLYTIRNGTLWCSTMFRKVTNQIKIFNFIGFIQNPSIFT